MTLLLSFRRDKTQTSFSLKITQDHILLLGQSRPMGCNICLIGLVKVQPGGLFFFHQLPGPKDGSEAAKDASRRESQRSGSHEHRTQMDLAA